MTEELQQTVEELKELYVELSLQISTHGWECRCDLCSLSHELASTIQEAQSTLFSSSPTTRPIL